MIGCEGAEKERQIKLVSLQGVYKVEKECWFKEVGDEARATRATVNITEEGEERKKHVLNIDRARLETRRNFFTIRAANEWNKLPDMLKELTSVNSFKNGYDKWKKTLTPEAAGGEDNATGVISL